MPRIIDDDYEMPDDEYDLPFDGVIARRKPPVLWPFALLALLVTIAIAAIYGFERVVERQNDDAFCISCHTDQHSVYAARGESAVAGAIAADLSSYHYQQIRGDGGNIRCIDCHRGDDSRNARIETAALSARISLQWLLRGDAIGLDASAAVITDSAGITTVIGSAAQLAPHLANDGCAACHSQTLLTAGIENHMHNTLPMAYALWKNGARLIAPNGGADAQAIAARGLTLYRTTVQCSDCHQAHRSTDDPRFIHQPTKDRTCVQCHTQAGVIIRPPDP